MQRLSSPARPEWPPASGGGSRDTPARDRSILWWRRTGKSNCRSSGRFWEGRFRSQALLDEGALLACLSYVDLNPIRAGLADTLADSTLTSIRERLAGTPTSLVPFAEEAVPGVAMEPLPVTRAAYVELLEWTLGALREESPASPIDATLGRFDLAADRFVDSVHH